MKSKKFLSFALALVMTLALLPMTAMAAVNDTFMVEGITYKVLTESEQTGTVQVGNGSNEVVPSDTTTVVIPDTVSYEGMTYAIASIGDYAFHYRDGLTSVTIPESVTTIGDNAFYHCSSLTSVSIPSSVTSIGIQAFYGCSSLTGVTIPNSVTSIGDRTFMGCRSLASVTIPNSVTSIGNNAFYNCDGLTSVTIPESVTTIGTQAFAYCDGLTSVSIPSRVTSIGNDMFYGCSSLTGVTIPNSVTSIGDYAFWGCTGLTGVTIPDGVTSIGRHAFSSCTNLASVIFDGNAPSIGTNLYLPTGAEALISRTATGFPAEGQTWNGLIVRYRDYAVKFVDWNGDLLEEQVVLPRGAATAPATPEREGYTFTGWDVDFSVITGNLTVTAQYEQNINKYTVTFVDWDGAVLDEQTVEEGSAATAPAAPEREGYTFTGWDVDFSNITGNLTVTAQYEQNINQYTVTFVDWDGTVLGEQTVEEGGAAESPEAVREGYSFLGWDVAFDVVTSDLTVTAQYRANKTGATPLASVEKLGGNKNNLTITITESFTDGTTEDITQTFSINNNAAGTYEVGPYKVYVDTKGNTQIRACYIVE